MKQQGTQFIMTYKFNNVLNLHKFYLISSKGSLKNERHITNVQIV